MSCAEAQSLLHAYIDAELDMANSLEVERHLQECAACRRAYNDYQALHAAIKGDSLYFQLPELLQKRVQAALHTKDPVPIRPRERPKQVRITPWNWLSAAAILLFAFFGIWGITRLWSPSAGQSSIARQVVDSHVRSLMANHLVDVPFTDQHSVRPWFEGKLAFSPPIIDLTSQGFTLIGGRIDYIDNQPVAAIVYKCGNHVINFFVWPASAPNKTVDTTTNLQGYNLVSWKAYGMNCWAVSDLNLDTLHQFAQLIDQRTDIALSGAPSALGP